MLDPIKELKYFLDHEDEFPEGASSELLQWCVEQEDFPNQQRFYARNELNIRKSGRAIIAIPKEEDDGTPMKREDGETLVDFAYTSGNYRTSKTPELVCWYPSPASTRYALNKVSDLLKEGKLPEPGPIIQYCENPFGNGTPVFYYLMTDEEREAAQVEYVCQLKEDTPVVHLLIPAPNGDIQLQWIPESFRKGYNLEPRPMRSSFLKEVCDKIQLKLNDQSSGGKEWGKSEPVGLGNDEGLEKILPQVDYSPRNRQEPGTEDMGKANLQITLDFMADSLRYVLIKLASLHSSKVIDYSTATIKSFGESIKALAEKTGDPEIVEMCQMLWDNDPRLCIEFLQKIDPKFQLDGETLSYDFGDDNGEQSEKEDEDSP